jgi:heme-degrading monooxygenase HmoA
MIIREWRGRAAKSNAEAYPEHFRTKVVPDLLQMTGFVGAELSKRALDDKIEYLCLTRWRSMDDIRAFAGPDVGKAVIEPGAEKVLVDWDDRVNHYEVAETI